MGRVKLKNRPARGSLARDASLPLAVDAKGIALSGAEFHRLLAAYQAHAETLPFCACEGVGNPLLLPPDMTRDELETARSAVLAYVGALSWQKSVGVPGVPAISGEFRAVLGDLLRPLQCRYLQIGIDADSLRIASEDILPGEPFILATRIDVNLGSPSLHVVRSMTVAEARHMLESQAMLGYLSPDEIAAVLARVKEGSSVKHEMLGSTRVAVGRGYAIPGAGGEVERWFRTHRDDLSAASDAPAQAASFLASMLIGTRSAPVLGSDALEVMRGMGALALHKQPSEDS